MRGRSGAVRFQSLRAIAGALLLPAGGCGRAVAGSDAAGTDAAPAQACANGLDDDGDALVDFPNDPGCAASDDGDELNALPQCVDGVDNDADALADLDDPDCVNALDDREAPSAACANGLDDDGDLLEDWTDDPGCTDAEDASENGVPSCTKPPPDLTATGTASGSFSTADASWFAGSCGGGGPEGLGVITVPSSLSQLSFSVSGDGLEVAAYARNACDDPGAEVGCTAGSGGAVLALGPVAPGPLWLVADAAAPASSGAWSMSVSGVIASGEPCAPEDAVFRCDLTAGETCRTPVPGVGPACFGPACSDGFDNDGDGLADHPYDCGCSDQDDADESDPAAPVECCDGADNDGDALVDFPADPQCEAAGDGLELL